MDTNKDGRLVVRVPEETKRLLLERAAFEDVPMSTVVRWALAAYFTLPKDDGMAPGVDVQLWLTSRPDEDWTIVESASHPGRYDLRRVGRTPPTSPSIEF